MYAQLSILSTLIGLLATAPLLLTSKELQIEFKPRSPEQMSSFYEARGFPKPMIDLLKQQCFITVGIHNISKQKIWLDLDQWHFSVDGKTVERLQRDDWKKTWQAMGAPVRNQSTFRWTLIPDNLDYLPGENEGGNIILPYTSQPITLEASFATGDDKTGPVIKLRYDKLYCAKDAP